MRSAAIESFKWKPVFPGANQGFSLIEVLVAMAIFSIGVLAVGTLILSTTRNNTHGDFMTQATMLARAKIEEKNAKRMQAPCPSALKRKPILTCRVMRAVSIRVNALFLRPAPSGKFG